MCWVELTAWKRTVASEDIKTFSREKIDVVCSPPKVGSPWSPLLRAAVLRLPLHPIPKSLFLLCCQLVPESSSSAKYRPAFSSFSLCCRNDHIFVQMKARQVTTFSGKHMFIIPNFARTGQCKFSLLNMNLAHLLKWWYLFLLNLKLSWMVKEIFNYSRQRTTEHHASGF